MLTGDNQKTAQALAKEVGIDQFFAELLPEDKVQAIENLKHSHTIVAMVGDGSMMPQRWLQALAGLRWEP